MPSKSNLTVSCPVCNAKCSNLPVSTYSAEGSAEHFCPRTRNADLNQKLLRCIQGLWGGESCASRVCSQCGFGFSDPFVGGNEEFYALLSAYSEYPSWRWDFDVAKDRVLGLSDGGKILDIGAGDGAFLRSLDGQWKRFAIEGSESTRKKLREHEIVVFQDFGEALEKHAGTFDVVTMFQTLEHIAEFRGTLEAARKLLCTGGWIIVTVPDGALASRQEDLLNCPDMPPNHVNRWTPASLSLALGSAGFDTSPAMREPLSWRNVKYAVYLRVRAAAARVGSITSQVYRIQRKSVRTPMLAFLGLFALVKLFPHVLELRKGKSIAVFGEAA